MISLSDRTSQLLQWSTQRQQYCPFNKVVHQIGGIPTAQAAVVVGVGVAAAAVANGLLDSWADDREGTLASCLTRGQPEEQLGEDDR